MRRRPEIQIALKNLFEKHINNLRIDKLGAIFSFLVKSQFPISQEDMRALSRAFKRCLLINTTAINSSTTEPPKEESDSGITEKENAKR